MWVLSIPSSRAKNLPREPEQNPNPWWSHALEPIPTHSLCGAPSSTTIIPSHKPFGRLIQCRTGHVFHRKYYLRFILTEPASCPYLIRACSTCEGVGTYPSPIYDMSAGFIQIAGCSIQICKLPDTIRACSTCEDVGTYPGKTSHIQIWDRFGIVYIKARDFDGTYNVRDSLRL